MRKLYLDTSALIPLYREETATKALIEILQPDDDLIITDLSALEFRSAFYKAVRQKEMSLSGARRRIDLFIADLRNYSVKRITDETWALSLDLLDKHGVKNKLRSLDSLHLASALELAEKRGLDYFLTLDNVLGNVANLEGLQAFP